MGNTFVDKIKVLMDTLGNMAFKPVSPRRQLLLSAATALPIRKYKKGDTS